jgi:hypothetical protein
VGTEPIDYCRQIESYLCGKNDGHLIRVVGPSFEIVSRWAERGVPLKVAYRGIDRYFERYYAKGPRRRPVKIDFCEADVLDVFDEWRRALGLTQSAVDSHQSSVDSHLPGVTSRQSLPAHLERVLLRLTNARARGTVGPEFEALIDRVAQELDGVRAGARSLRGEAREAAIGRLGAIDAALSAQALAGLDEAGREALEREADEALAGYRAAMMPDAYARARAAAVDRLLRERLGLPVVKF